MVFYCVSSYKSELLRFDRVLGFDRVIGFDRVLDLDGGNAALNAARFCSCLTFFATALLRVWCPLITLCSFMGATMSYFCSLVRNTSARQLIHLVGLYFSCSSGCTGHDHICLPVLSCAL
jgi:hypothetical protein